MNRARLVLGLVLAALAAAALVWVFWDDDERPQHLDELIASNEFTQVAVASMPATRSADPIRSKPFAAPTDAAPEFDLARHLGNVMVRSPQAETAPDDPNLRRVEFLITDRLGKPIEQARVLAGQRTSPPTGPDGKTALLIAKDVHAVVAGAPYFRIESVPLPTGSSDAVTIALTRASVLVVRVRHQESPDLLRNLRMCIDYALEESTADAEGSSEFGEVRIARPGGSQGIRRQVGGKLAGVQTLCYSVRVGEDITISGFKDGDQVTARVEDNYAGALIQQRFTLVAEETTAVELVVTSRPRDLRGMIIDDRGAPLPGARVNLVGRGSAMQGEPETSDATGAFLLRDVYQSDPTVAVSLTDFVFRALPWQGDTMTIQLERGRTIHVRLSGGNVDEWSGRANFEVDAGSVHASSFDKGRGFYFYSVPRRAGKITVHGPRSKTTTPIGPDETEIDVARPE